MNESAIRKDIGKLKFLSEEEEKYLFDIRPNLREYQILSFQESLRNCLQEYLSTPFLLSFRGSKNIGLLKRDLAQLSIEYKNTNFKSRINDIPAIISFGYLQLKQLLSDHNISTNKTIIELYPPKEKYYDNYPILQNFIKYTQAHLSKYLKYAIIHGSCSDLELTGFSDLDTFLIIKEETLGTEESLRRFKRHWIKSLKYLYKFDSLQHHNHMLASEYDLLLLPYHWLPPQILMDAKSIFGFQKLVIATYKNRYYNSKVFFQLTQRFRNPKTIIKKQNEYSLKNDISILSLLPVLYLQIIGLDVTKKESFYNPLILSIDGQSFFKKISQIRVQWKATQMSGWIISRYYNFYLRKIYLKFLICSIGTTELTKSSMFKQKVIEELNLIIDRMSAEIIKNGK